MKAKAQSGEVRERVIFVIYGRGPLIASQLENKLEIRKGGANLAITLQIIKEIFGKMDSQKKQEAKIKGVGLAGLGNDPDKGGGNRGGARGRGNGGGRGRGRDGRGGNGRVGGGTSAAPSQSLRAC